MKVYRLYSNINEQMDLESAIDYLQESLHFTLDDVIDVESVTAQSEMIEVLLESYFIVEEIEENDECYEDDMKEREQEYRELQGF